MKKLIYHIVRLALVIIPAMLTVAPAMAQKPVPTIVVNRADTIEFSVVEWPGDRYTWDLYVDSTLNFALENDRLEPALYFVDGMYEGNTVYVTNLDPGIYFLRVMVWDEVNCTNNLQLFRLEVLDIPEADLYGMEACYGDPTYLEVVLTGTGPWEVIYTDGMEDSPLINLNGNPGEALEIPIPMLSMTPADKIIIKELWITYINDLGTNTENLEPSNPAKIVVYPVPAKSKIYVKPEDEEEN
jgi:hypothetical protein